MTTLIIHQNDITTDFLSMIYENCDYTILREHPGSSKLKEFIKSHDRIIMMGHGDNHGLYGRFGMLIDSNLVYLLREKYCICIWCNADKFVEKYNLKGLYTGMIISEYEEALLYGINPTLREIDDSNAMSAEQMKIAINENSFINLKYDSDTNQVIKFNKQNLYKN